MRKFINRFFILISFLVLGFTGCKNNAGGTFTGGNKQPLTIDIATNENLKIFNTSDANSRTIVADAYKIGSAGDTLYFYLYGNAQSGQELAPKIVTVTSSDGIHGKVTLDIDCYNWELTLVACETDGLSTEAEILADAVLIGYANVDMMFTNEIKFTLSPKGLTKKGTVKLDLSLDGDWPIPEGYVAKANIFQLKDGEPLTGVEQTIADMAASPTTNSFGTAGNYTANGMELDPGTYSFQVSFEKAGENRKYYYNDTLIILPGKELAQAVVIPNLLGTKPAAPSDFAVEYDSNSEDEDYMDFYTAHFTWDGTAVNNEMNFAIDLIEIADDVTTLPATWDNSAWESISKNKEWTFDYLHDVRNDPLWKEGSLFANNSEIYLYLELGKRYFARISSENNAGKSDYVYVTLPANYTSINRYRIKYNLQGGTWDEGTTSTNPKITYHGQITGAPYEIIVPNAETPAANNPKLTNGASDWYYWTKGLGGEKYPVIDDDYSKPEDYQGFANLDLYAVYKREGDVEVYNDKNYDIAEAYVAGFAIAAGNISKTSTNTFSKADGEGTAPDTTTTLSLTLPTPATDTDPTWLYDKVSLTITYAGKTYFDESLVGEARGTPNTFTIPLQNFPTGYVYNCLLTARYQKTTVSYPFTIYITD